MSLQIILRCLDLPHNGIGDAGVDTQCAEKGSGVLDGGRLGAEQHSEADYTKQGGKEIAKTTLAGAVGDVTDGDGQDGGGGVGRD